MNAFLSIRYSVHLSSLNSLDFSSPLMGHPLSLPKELLELVFEALNRPDLVSCSYTSWFWNDTANALLYREISLNRVKNLFRTLAPAEIQNGPDTAKVTTRRWKLGSFVKVIKTIDTDAGQISHPVSFMLELTKLDLFTPNVHTVELYDVMTVNRNPYWSSTWQSNLSELKWQHLKRLTIISSGLLVYGDIWNGFFDILLQIEHLNTLDAKKFLSCGIPSTPVTLNLLSLKVSVQDKIQYDHLMTMLQSCRSTLQSLAIQWLSSDAIPEPLSLENIIRSQLNLKAFALTYHKSSTLTISSFGDQIEVLEVIGNRRGNEQVEVEIGKAMMKTSKLKTLSLGTCSYFAEYIPTIIDRNKMTLHSLYLTSDVGDELIDLLLAANIRADYVTTLCFECRYLDKSMIHSLAEIFPSVEYLGLARGKAKSDRKWIATQSLSHFRNLIGIDIWTYRELVDPSSYHGSKYKIRRPLMLTSAPFGDYSM
jgi:F-box-like